jgi:hypothetical protein
MNFIFIICIFNFFIINSKDKVYVSSSIKNIEKEKKSEKKVCSCDFSNKIITVEKLEKQKNEVNKNNINDLFEEVDKQNWYLEKEYINKKIDKIDQVIEISDFLVKIALKNGIPFLINSVLYDKNLNFMGVDCFYFIIDTTGVSYLDTFFNKNFSWSYLEKEELLPFIDAIAHGGWLYYSKNQSSDIYKIYVRKKTIDKKEYYIGVGFYCDSAIHRINYILQNSIKIINEKGIDFFINELNNGSFSFIKGDSSVFILDEDQINNINQNNIYLEGMNNKLVSWNIPSYFIKKCLEEGRAKDKIENNFKIKRVIVGKKIVIPSNEGKSKNYIILISSINKIKQKSVQNFVRKVSADINNLGTFDLESLLKNNNRLNIDPVSVNIIDLNGNIYYSVLEQEYIKDVYSKYLFNIKDKNYGWIDIFDQKGEGALFFQRIKNQNLDMIIFAIVHPSTKFFKSMFIKNILEKELEKNKDIYSIYKKSIEDNIINSHNWCNINFASEDGIFYFSNSFYEKSWNFVKKNNSAWRYFIENNKDCIFERIYDHDVYICSPFINIIDSDDKEKSNKNRVRLIINYKR